MPNARVSPDEQAYWDQPVLKKKVQDNKAVIGELVQIFEFDMYKKIKYEFKVAQTHFCANCLLGGFPQLLPCVIIHCLHYPVLHGRVERHARNQHVAVFENGVQFFYGDPSAPAKSISPTSANRFLPFSDAGMTATVMEPGNVVDGVLCFRITNDVEIVRIEKPRRYGRKGPEKMTLCCATLPPLHTTDGLMMQGLVDPHGLVKMVNSRAKGGQSNGVGTVPGAVAIPQLVTMPNTYVQPVMAMPQTVQVAVINYNHGVKEHTENPEADAQQGATAVPL